MVAIPSKGCTTCRKRKKGCDRKLPSCGQCLDSGRSCGGYVRKATFIQYQPPSDTSSSPESNVLPSSVLHVSSESLNLHLVAYRSLIVDQFWTIYLLAKELRTSRFSDLSTGWYDVASCQSPDDPALKHALLALSLKRLSLGNPDDVRRQHGMNQYGKALKELSVALRVKERRTSDEILYACTALTLYEIVSAFQARKKIFLNPEAWMNIPFSVHPKSLGDRILDIFARVPGMLEQFDEAYSDIASPTLVAEKLGAVVYECQSMDIQLQTWYTDLMVFCSSQPELNWPSQLLNSPLETPLHYFSLAHITMIYWAISTVIYTNLHQALRERHTLDPASPNPSKFRSARSAPGQYATNIRHAAPYFFRPGMRGVGATNASFPMAAAALYFSASGNKEELDHLLAPHIGTRFGFILLGFMGSLKALAPRTLGGGTERESSEGMANTAVQWWGFVIEDQ